MVKLNIAAIERLMEADKHVKDSINNIHSAITDSCKYESDYEKKFGSGWAFIGHCVPCVTDDTKRVFLKTVRDTQYIYIEDFLGNQLRYILTDNQRAILEEN